MNVVIVVEIKITIQRYTNTTFCTSTMSSVFSLSFINYKHQVSAVTGALLFFIDFFL